MSIGGGQSMGRKSAYRAIVRSHVDEKLAIVRIIRSRVRRKLAELELERHRQLAGARQAWGELRVKLKRLAINGRIGRDS